MSAQPKSDERRKYRRVSDAIALQIRQSDEAANEQDYDAADLPHHPTHVVSLSPNGLKCYHDEQFNDGETLKLSMRLFPGGERLDTEARVINSGEESNKPNKNNRFFAGLSFVNLTGERKQRLLDHMDRVARESFGSSVKLVNK